MNNAIAIRFDYSDERKNPEDILLILSEYVKFYKRIGIITLSSIDEKDSAQFDLVSLQDGSAVAWIRCKIAKWENFLFNSAEDLADYIDNNPEIATCEDLEAASNFLSTSISKNVEHQLLTEPYIDMEQLGKALSDYSALNSKLYTDETASIGIGQPGTSDFSDFKTLTKNFVFSGNVVDMFSSEIKHFKRTSKFYVHVPVNKGNNVWRLEELTTENHFAARVVNSDWLENYQSGFIDPIGPKDLIEAIIEYDEVVAKISDRKSRRQIRNAKILEVLNINRNRGEQDGLF
ncbi:hypothetical protein F3J31_14310 [Enterobacter sp. Acro-832]|jgi:hypothetical protein|uniref:hypothetical protein n=1 Tax=Enterobacter sp. Acro-832 TaxID=2608348 RepID=UPI00141E681C|nr:hypothetical protein [Enterobacter sp. Acro-832]NIG44984.1 hypothetical protein [Enterobacter sp. Acro-832]